MFENLNGNAINSWSLVNLHAVNRTFSFCFSWKIVHIILGRMLSQSIEGSRIYSRFKVKEIMEVFSHLFKIFGLSDST